MSNAAIFLCAGSGTRMRGQVDDKVLTPLAGKPTIIHSLDAFRESGIVESIVFAYRDEEQRDQIQQALDQADTTGLQFFWVEGGKERQDSVFNALLELSLLVEYVFIHDCARPLVRPEVLRELYQAVMEDKAAVLAHRVADTIKKASGTKRTRRGRMLKDVPRASLWAMETPQAFERELITDAYRRLRFDGVSVTDDTAAVTRQDHGVTLVENLYPNPKLTVPADLPYLEFLLTQKNQETIKV
ncbi:2-C-methyl-D-erythritol 4-phosphate cytidylyltransferase [Rubellicoccus peritrichatus]|uniref:2-C-methyl-D-erythritol 4-phosphate cytidylyltransferase n=1 Tax=Rubellicoccus peritrichatus TaxID=3080537 RepID=A0AAQ3L9N0_9BACT|nr:2-C-methyl-D-erythritol 4-phosphate cytidylyltransferase [Puniceicoccus sp. CR14]WOO41396.1 2-C-methyl-D-erythritol 4-phosphate cytidylyltransferase [Puniceicoccus sp. CR14]